MVEVAPKSAFRSSTVISSAVGSISGIAMLAMGFLADPATLNSAAQYAENKGHNDIAKIIKNYILPTITIGATMGAIRGRFAVGDLFTPKRVIGKNKEDIVQGVSLEKVAGKFTLGEVISTATDVKETVTAFTGSTSEGLKELKDLVVNLNNRLNDMPNQFPAQDIAHLPGPTPESQHVNRGQNFREPPRNRFEPPKEDREPAQQVELSGVPFDVTQSSDGVVQEYLI